MLKNFVSAFCSEGIDKADAESYGELYLDFNKIIPEPENEDECPEEFLLKEEDRKGIRPITKKPWFDWYNWRLFYWGTKWGAKYSTVGTIRKNMRPETKEKLPYHMEIIYDTAWSPAAGIIGELTYMIYKKEVEAGTMLFENFYWDPGMMYCGVYINQSERYGSTSTEELNREYWTILYDYGVIDLAEYRKGIRDWEKPKAISEETLAKSE